MSVFLLALLQTPSEWLREASHQGKKKKKKAFVPLQPTKLAQNIGMLVPGAEQQQSWADLEKQPQDCPTRESSSRIIMMQMQSGLMEPH